MVLGSPAGRHDEVYEFTSLKSNDHDNASDDHLERQSSSSASSSPLPDDDNSNLSTTSLSRQTSAISSPSFARTPISDPAIRRLYISHFLSYWNSRVFEFGSVLFLASIFPGTILPLSVYALVRGVAAILFSPAVGKYIDVGERLQVVRLSIGKNE